MAVSTYALIDVAGAKVWLDGLTGASKDTLFETIIDQSSALIEEYLGREIITRGNLTDYHTFDSSSHDLFTYQWPIITVTTVHEDSNREYGADELLTENTDYLVVKPKGKIIRTVSATSGRQNWLRGFKAVKVVYSAGYADRDAVPLVIKDVCSRHVASVFRQITRKTEELARVSDDMGSFARFGPALLTSGMKQDLHPFKRIEFSRTAEQHT